MSISRSWTASILRTTMPVTRRRRHRQILGWEARLASVIVQRAGQLP